jgi:glyoxylase-like metal-dependent hydrolase (beta-lactamase superfamily II)
MKVTPIIASRFTTDGGAMFGLVPKPIWSRLIEADENNRIHQHAHSLLVELDDGRKGLIDTGCGPAGKFSDKELALNGLGSGWPLIEQLEALGIRPAAISFVIFSHLHWDHAGGASPDGELPAFPNAMHFVHASEWKDATSGDPLLYKSYPAATIAPLRELPEDQLHLVKGEREKILPGITLARSGGHTRGHSMIILEAESGIDIVHPEAIFMFKPRRILFAGDVCPMRHNLRMVYQTAYDTFPLETRQWKSHWLPVIAENQTLIMFDHDPDLFGATIKPHPRKEFVIDKTLHTAVDGNAARSLDELEARGRFLMYSEEPLLAG